MLIWRIGGGSPQLKLEKTDIVVNAFPAIDSAGLYIAQDQGLFAAQGLHVTIVPVPKNGPPPSTQDLVNGQEKGTYDITAGDYVTYVEDQLGFGGTKADLRIIAESSFLQPNVLTLLVKGGSPISQVSQLKGKTVSVNAPNDIGTLLVDSLLVSHGLRPQQIHYATNVPFPAVVPTLTAPNTPVAASFAPEPFVSGGEAAKGLEELADLDQGATQDFPIQGYAVTAKWAKQNPDTDRAAVENVLAKYLNIDKQAAAFISLPAFPLGVDAVRLQRVVSAMKRFSLLPKSTNFQVTSMITG
jgi:NitT/TauT family transport system substrate-binding protein